MDYLNVSTKHFQPFEPIRPKPEFFIYKKCWERKSFLLLKDSSSQFQFLSEEVGDVPKYGVVWQDKIKRFVFGQAEWKLASEQR